MILHQFTNGRIPAMWPLHYSQRLGKFIFENGYWERAWVDQEIQVARKLLFWIHTIPFNPGHLQRIRELVFDTFIMLEDKHYSDYHNTIERTIDSDLITLLDRFAYKKCSRSQDRVFSLLYLCAVGPSAIPVDYDMPLTTLAYLILCQHPGRLCLCTIQVVATALRIGEANPDEALGVSNGPWIKYEVR